MIVPSRNTSLTWFAGMMLVGVCLASFSGEAEARSGEAAFQVEIPAGAWKGARLENIPAGASIAVMAQADGPVRIALLGDDDLDRVDLDHPVFEARTEDRLSFTVRAPASGDYYVVIDNRSGEDARSVAIEVRGETGDDHAAAALDSDVALQKLETHLGTLFAFESFPIQVRTCAPGARVEATGVVICREYLGEIRRVLDRAELENVLLFTLLHDIAHELLRQWSHPGSDSEETADEFATVLMVMLDQQNRLRSETGFLRANASLRDHRADAGQDAHHPLSERRATNVRRWSEDAELVRRWQSILVPRMETRLLEQLNEAPKPWTDVARVRQELAARP